jgi:hypothetical protein
MMRFVNIVGSAALTATLIPIAANATILTPLDHAQIETKAICGPLPEARHIAANCDASTAPRLIDQTIAQNGRPEQKYPDSVGG